MNEVTILVFYDCIEHNPNLLLNKARTHWGTDKYVLKYKNTDRTIYDILAPLFDAHFIWTLSKYDMINNRRSDEILLFSQLCLRSYYYLAPIHLNNSLDEFVLKDAKIEFQEQNCNLEREKKWATLLTKENTLYNQILKKCYREQIDLTGEQLPLKIEKDYVR